MRTALASLVAVFALGLATAAPHAARAQSKLLLTQVAYTPTPAEYVAITNQGTSTVNLANYYLADFDAYWGVVTSTPPANTSDFLVRFPASASIAAGETVTVSIGGAECFNSACGTGGAGLFSGFGFYPSYEILPTATTSASAAVPDMVVPFAGAVGSSRGLTNGGEPVILFYWDGVSALVTDVDYVCFGTPSASNPGVNKTGVVSMGSTYFADTPDSATTHAPVASGLVGATCRSDSLESGMTTTGGNGIAGRDETSEPTSLTWIGCADPMPMMGVVDGGVPVDLGVDLGPPPDLGVDMGPPPTDLGVDFGTDAGPTDLGTDLGDVDGGDTDAGGMDAGGTDAGGSDAGHIDAGSMDGAVSSDGGGPMRDLGVVSGGRRGGCCAVAGTSSSPGALALLAVLGVVLAARIPPTRARLISSAAMYCQVCGADAPTKYVTFMQNIGVVVVRFTSTTRGNLCRRCIDSTFWTKTLITLFAGWWGIISLIFTPFILVMNIVNYIGALSLPKLPEQPTPFQLGSTGPSMQGGFAPGGPVQISGGGGFGARPTRPGGGKGPLIAAGVVGVLSIGCCVMIGAMAAGGSFLSSRVEASGVACEGRPVPGAPPYVQGASGTGIVAMQRSGGRWTPEFGVVPTSFNTADTTAEAAVVLCLEPQTDETVETCDYTTGARVTRIRHTRRYRAVVASTGALLRDETIEGPAPATCADTIEGTANTTLDGDDVDGDAIIPFLGAALGLAPAPPPVGGPK